MARIRHDFVGSVLVHASSGSLFLVAGDELPDGVACDASLLEADSDTSDEVTPEAEPEAEPAAVEPEAEPEAEAEAEAEAAAPKVTPKRTRRASKT
ncbi:hypothetical protein CMUST_15750 (plasmid) [Corynebacterium mustelae]|uniref:Uncharacterized protein n=1 Tax=Corynebacterium mustelae TaxID=571915 RepID=A0A0G3GVQ0_9CORY|nr:hypothetical protein [Corynebacterium mustelae]AKK05236.1 hypothetical protein CMUST_04470 [Corynebacterium mustelae]AKK07438.1 hypothetical protein CMUST_15750 [Corynebacterium mustelae]